MTSSNPIAWLRIYHPDRWPVPWSSTYMETPIVIDEEVEPAPGDGRVYAWARPMRALDRRSNLVCASGGDHLLALRMRDILRSPVTLRMDEYGVLRSVAATPVAVVPILPILRPIAQRMVERAARLMTPGGSAECIVHRADPVTRQPLEVDLIRQDAAWAADYARLRLDIEPDARDRLGACIGAAQDAAWALALEGAADWLDSIDPVARWGMSWRSVNRERQRIWDSIWLPIEAEIEESIRDAAGVQA